MKLAELLETKPCSRCGGCGRHSYCSMYGDTCFGCSGTGKKFAGDDAKVADDYYHAKDLLKSFLAKNLQPGDIIAHPSQTIDKNGKTLRPWITVISVEVTDQWCSRGRTGSAEYEDYFRLVTLSDGTIDKMNATTCCQLRHTLEDILNRMEPKNADRLRKAIASYKAKQEAP